MIKRDGLIFKLKKRIVPILKKGGVSKASIFGSFARREKKYNDIIKKRILAEKTDIL